MPSISNSNYRLGAKRLTIRSIAVALLLAVTVVGRASVDEVVRWNKVATDATVAAKINPLAESRIFAILHVAIHDAVNAVEPRYEPYQPGTSPAPAGASVDAAIAGAAHATLVALLPDSKATFDAALEETLRGITDDSRRAIRSGGWTNCCRGDPHGTARRRCQSNCGLHSGYEARRILSHSAGL